MTTAPAFRLAPASRRRLNQARLGVDLAGLLLVRLFLPLVHSSLIHWLLTLYTVAAWVTILTVDSTRIPEAATTRVMQRRAWRYVLYFIPYGIALWLVLALCFRQTVLPHPLASGSLLSLMVRSYTDEMLFRNTLQPKLRQWGLHRWMAVGTQSLLYACAIWTLHAPLDVTVAFFLLAWSNGWVVARYKSLWPAFLISLIWNVAWFG